MTQQTTDSDADELDQRAEAILEVTRACWRILSDLAPDDKTIALDKLPDMLTLEQLSHIPAAERSGSISASRVALAAAKARDAGRSLTDRRQVQPHDIAHSRHAGESRQH